MAHRNTGSSKPLGTEFSGFFSATKKSLGKSLKTGSHWGRSFQAFLVYLMTFLVPRTAFNDGMVSEVNIVLKSSKLCYTRSNKFPCRFCNKERQ